MIISAVLLIHSYSDDSLGNKEPPAYHREFFNRDFPYNIVFSCSTTSKFSNATTISKSSLNYNQLKSLVTDFAAGVVEDDAIIYYLGEEVLALL